MTPPLWAWLCFLALDLTILVLAWKFGLHWRKLPPARRFGAACRRYWKRILIGAFVGWFASTILGAMAFAWLSLSTSLDEGTLNLAAAAWVWGATLGAAVAAYALRPSDG